MVNVLFGFKKGMISTYDSRGRRVGATLIEVTPNFVVRVKKKESKDGYDAVQLAFQETKRINKPQQGELKKAGIEKNLRFIREVRFSSDDQLHPGQEIRLTDVFAPGDLVKITGTSKGRGFQGVVKRHGFAGGPKTHGQSDRLRAPGSIGSGTTPGRVLKGKRMAGHMGGETVTITGLEVIAIDTKNNILTVKGGVPGPIGQVLRIENLKKKVKGYVPPAEPAGEEGEAESAKQGSSEATTEVKEEEKNNGQS